MIEMKIKITNNSAKGAVDVVSEGFTTPPITQAEVIWAAIVTSVIAILSKSDGDMKKLFHQKIAWELESRINASVKAAIETLNEAAKKEKMQ